MVRTLYHGSPNIIEKPIYGYGKTYNDYGLGFYCTDSLDMAKEWGAGKDRDGYANCYRLDCDGLRILHLNDPQFCILNWLAVLLQNREFDVPSGLALEAKEYTSNILGWSISPMMPSLAIGRMIATFPLPRTSSTAPFPTAN